MAISVLQLVFDGTQDSIAQTWTAVPQLAITVGVVPSDGFGAIRPWLTNRWQGGATVNVSERWQGSVYLTLIPSSGASVQPAAPPQSLASSHYQISVGNTSAFASPQTFVIQPYVASDVTAIRVHMRNIERSGGLQGSSISGVSLGIGQSNGSLGYVGTPTVYTGITVPGASEYVSPWTSVTPGTDSRVVIAYTAPSGSSPYINGGGYLTMKNVSGTANVNPIPAGSPTLSGGGLPYDLYIEYYTAKKRVVVLGDSIVAGYNQYFDRPDINLSFAYGLGPDHAYAIDAFGIPATKLATYVNPSNTWMMSTQAFAGAYVVVEAGVNDLPTMTFSQYQANVASMVSLLQTAGAKKIVWCTITPSTTYGAYDTLRQTCNTWMLANYASLGIDAVCDAATTLQNPANHSVLLPAYDSGDGIHLIVAGAQAYEAAVYATVSGLP